MKNGLNLHLVLLLKFKIALVLFALLTACGPMPKNDTGPAPRFVTGYWLSLDRGSVLDTMFIMGGGSGRLKLTVETGIGSSIECQIDADTVGDSYKGTVATDANTLQVDPAAANPNACAMLVNMKSYDVNGDHLIIVAKDGTKHFFEWFGAN